jgi:hypothetical protein
LTGNNAIMPKRSSKLKPVEPTPPEAAPPVPAPEPPPLLTPDGKNAAAVMLGRRGGLKGGPARAAKLTKKQLSDIGKRAAAARWGKKKD